MTKSCVTLAVDEGVLRIVKMRTERTGESESQVIEEALLRDFHPLERIWAKARHSLSEEEGMKLAISELKAMRKERDEAGDF